MCFYFTIMIFRVFGGRKKPRFIDDFEFFFNLGFNLIKFDFFICECHGSD